MQIDKKKSPVQRALPIRPTKGKTVLQKATDLQNIKQKLVKSSKKNQKIRKNRLSKCHSEMLFPKKKKNIIKKKQNKTKIKQKSKTKEKTGSKKMQTQKNVKVKIAKHKPNERPKKYQSKKWFGIELYFKEQKSNYKRQTCIYM